MTTIALQPVVWLGAATTVAFLTTSLAHAGDVSLIRATSGATDSTFGQTLAHHRSGAVSDVLIGAPAANGARGFVELVQISGQQATTIASLAPAGLLANERFGYSVALSGSTIAVGSPFGTSARGKVRVFPRLEQGIGEPVIIESPDGAINDAFGHAVATAGDWLAVGEPLDDAGGSATDRGAVHLFRRSSGGAWVAQARIVAPDARAGDTFGYTLATDGSTLVVSSRYADVGAMDQAGVVWTVDLGADGTVGVPVRVEAPDPGAYEWFGASVAIDGDTLVVGACRDTINAQASEQGTARVFARDAAGWVQRVMLVSPGAATQDRFGNSVAIESNQILVGADGQDPQGVSLAGRLHLYSFDASSWSHQQAFELPNADVNQNLGVSCAVHGTMVFGGAPRHTPSGGVTREGAVGVWSLSARCPADVDHDGVVGGPDLGLLLTQWDASGSADLNGDGVVGAADLGIMLASWGACPP